MNRPQHKNSHFQSEETKENMMITNPQNSILKPGPTPIKPGLNQQITNPSLNPNYYSPSSLSKNPSHLQKPHLPSQPLMALSLSRPRHRSLTNPSLIQLFSSSSSSTTSPSDDPSASQSQQQQQQQQSSFSDYFSDVKASLKPQNPQNQPNLPPLRRPTYPTNTANQSVSKPTSNIASFDEIRKNLSEFRRRSSVPSPTDPNSAPSQQPSSSQKISFQDLYKKNVLEKSKSEGGSGTTQSSRPNSGTNTNQPIAGRFSFDGIRESLRQMRGSNNNNIAGGRGGGEGMPFSNFKLKPGNENESWNKSTIIGGTEGLPSAVFGKEKEEGSAKRDISTEFVKMYSYAELGDKLKRLRPEVKKGEKGWFTLEELNERLRKLREMEENETESRIGGVCFKDLRESLSKLKTSDDDKKKNSIQRLNLLGQLGTQNFTLGPPKKNLVEKYFHPDNMSSPEKMKIELAKVRDEFKMSESDCGSARVQVALLTTKIKHLSSVLHKKDKHSRKGLVAMVQKRKKLLKYLRRTDWDSYCLVLSKFGLRDNPDHKSLTRV